MVYSDHKASDGLENIDLVGLLQQSNEVLGKYSSAQYFTGLHQKQNDKIGDYLSRLSGVSAESPDYPQFLKFPCKGNVNAVVDGEVADLTRLPEEEEEYLLMFESVGLCDTLPDLPQRQRQNKWFIDQLFNLDLTNISLLCLGNGRVLVPLAVCQEYFQVLHKSCLFGRAITDSARESIYWIVMNYDILMKYSFCQVYNEVS